MAHLFNKLSFNILIIFKDLVKDKTELISVIFV